MIVCCGEALIDMLPAQTGEGRSAYVPHTGGAVFNTAIALGRLGARVGLFTGLSNDHFGRLLEADLIACGVDISLAVRSERPTTLAFVRLEAGQASYTFYDENSAGRMLELDDLPDLGPSVRALFCGGISLVVEPAADAYTALVEREKDRRLIMVDPNIRPAFVTNEARYRARLGRVIEAADILKVSDEDLRWLVPNQSTITEQVRALAGPAITIVTKGAEGASAYLPDDACVQVEAEEIALADTVGAGDAFNAGLLHQLLGQGSLSSADLRQVSRSQIREALHFAQRVAGITVSRAGADPPWASELEPRNSH